jgi:hypothetical protein
MIYRSFLVLICGLMFVSQTFAAPKEKPYTHYAAIATANSINRYTSIEEFVTSLGYFRNKEEATQLRAELEKRGLVLTEKFPKMSYTGNKVYFDKNNWVTYGSKTVTINGKTFPMQTGKMSEVFATICGKIKCDRKTASFSIFPEAHATLSRGWLTALAGLGGALVGNQVAKYNCENGQQYYQNNYNGYNPNQPYECNTGTATLIGGALAAGATWFATQPGQYYTGNENRYGCNYNCTVSCNPGGGYGGGGYGYQGPSAQPIYNQPVSGSGRYTIPTSTIGAYPSGGPYQNCNQAPAPYISDLQRDLNYGGGGYPGNYNNYPGGNPVYTSDSVRAVSSDSAKEQEAKKGK